jgi:hypothetical protein
VHAKTAWRLLRNYLEGYGFAEGKMNRQRRSGIVWGILFILAGVWFLADQLFPGLTRWLQIDFAWPLIIVGVGVLMLVIGLLTGEADMAIPACVIGGIGLLLYWQNATDNWESWAYAWTLIPGFVGVGTLISGLFGGRSGRRMSEGLGLIVTSVILFFIFSSFLGGWNLLGPYWPVLIILLGIWLLIRPLFRTRSVN